MYSRPPTSILASPITAQEVSRLRHIAVRLLLWVCAIDILIASALFVKLSFFPQSGFLVAAAAPLEQKVELVVGPATKNYMENLSESGLDPVAVKSVTHIPLTINGSLVTLAGDTTDNIQVFEYPDPDTALTEAAALNTRYASRARSKAWKANMHVYVEDSLVIFYMGSRAEIIAALESPLQNN